MPPPIDTDEIASKLEQVLQNQRDADKKLDTLAASWLEMHQRLIAVEGQAQGQALAPMRLPYPSLTLEERRDVHQVQTQSMMQIAKTSKWTPYAAFLGAVIAATILSLTQSCHGIPIVQGAQAATVITDAGVQ